ncbi:MAG TPA: helix-turn-helix domain-containing protein [Solirubrobacteraceae bacterium]|nr:helix-turn-helix domain-containing protein [Solirubrobacteraceae bacterium]
MAQAAATPTPDRHARRRAQTRAKLVAAARELFAARGVDATTIAEIAARADTAHGSFYNHFSSKEEILSAVFEDTLAEQLRLLEERRAGVTDPAERVAVAHRLLLAAVRADPEWGWLLVRLPLPHAILAAVLGDDAEADLRDGIAAGRFDVEDIAVALHASGGALLGTMALMLTGGGGAEAERMHAAGVLRMLGLAPGEAAAIAARALPTG